MSGDQYERDLVNALDACGFVAMRAPSSGSATARDLPDVLALRPDYGDGMIHERPVGYPATYALAVEVKATSATTAYADAGEVEALVEFAEDAGGIPFVGARFKRQGKRTPFYLVPPDECRMTDGGNYGVPESDAEDRAELVVWNESATNDPRVVRAD